jgi:hypothetical protein
VCDGIEAFFEVSQNSSPISSAAYQRLHKTWTPLVARRCAFSKKRLNTITHTFLLSSHTKTKEYELNRLGNILPKLRVCFRMVSIPERGAHWWQAAATCEAMEGKYKQSEV